MWVKPADVVENNDETCTISWIRGNKALCLGVGSEGTALVIIRLIDSKVTEVGLTFNEAWKWFCSNIEDYKKGA